MTLRLAAVLGLLFVLPSTAGAQVFCSAPHSAPTIAASGSITTLSRGAGWMFATVYRVRSDQAYASDGTVQGFIGNGRTTTTSAFLTAAVGITWGLELWAQLPLHSLAYDDVTGTRERAGVGDPRVSLRIGSELFTQDAWPVSVRVGIKLPGSDFPVDAGVLPLSEGQIDYEATIESGWSFQSVPIYAVGWVGHRWRGEDGTSETKPGDELFGHLAVGGRIARIRVELALEALEGGAPTRSGVSFPANARRLLQLNPQVGIALGSGTLELGAQMPVSGRSMPTGTGVSVGYSMTWGGL